MILILKFLSHVVLSYFGDVSYYLSIKRNLKIIVC